MSTLELRTEKMAFEGRAIARWGRFVIFIEGALPGERVVAEITQRKRRYAHARLLSVLEPSPHRIEAPCPVFAECGGCAFQNMSYPAQVQMKQQVLADSLRGLPGATETMQPILPCPATFHFRNKMVFAFGRREQQPVLGLHARGDWQKVVSAEQCLLESPEAASIVAEAILYVRQHSIPVWDDLNRTGLLRHLVIREGKHTNERMIHIHTAADDPSVDALALHLAPRCTTVLVSAHLNVPEAAPEHATRILKGSGVIHEQLNGLIFEIGPTTFFQTNTIQAERMFAMLADWAQELRPARAVDFYAGTGPIAAHLSRIASQVVAIESNPASVRAARRNFALNAIENVVIECGEVEKQAGAPVLSSCDLVVVDPPRPGLHPKAVQCLSENPIPALIYVSCNPATLARDLKLLTLGPYAIKRIQPIDLFPHAFHVETMVLLVRQ